MKLAIAVALLICGLCIAAGAWIEIAHAYASQTDRGDAELLAYFALVIEVPVVCAACLPAWILTSRLRRPRAARRQALILLAVVALPVACLIVALSAFAGNLSHWVEWTAPALFFLPTILSAMGLGLIGRRESSA
ncbi:MAG: hypothetical protein BIFFINMI_03766 [Phycisphaerae bacterium]|nr:hypothetical protein [Phycisphaerae bacterium]